jgi:uncharacterized protein
MIIKISNLVEGKHEFSFDESIKKIELEDPFFGNFHSDVVLNKLHDQLIVEVHTTVNAKFECDRCSTEFSAILKNDYVMVYLMNESPVDTEALNVAYLRHDAATINLKNDLKEFAVLSVPMKKLCNTDCKGLCYRCGGDLNKGECTCKEPKIDPRWQKLIDLKKNIKQ